MSPAEAQQAFLCIAIFTPDMLSSPRAQNPPSLADSLHSRLDPDLGMAASAPLAPGLHTQAFSPAQSHFTVSCPWLACSKPYSIGYLLFCHFVLFCVWASMSFPSGHKNPLSQEKEKQNFPTKLFGSIISVHCLNFLNTYYYSLSMIHLLLYGFHS